MGYLFLSLALLMGAIKGFCGKKVSFLAESFKHTFLICVLRMVFCVVIGLFVVLIFEGTISALNVSGTMLLISALSGICTSIFIVSWLIAAKNGALMMLDVFLSLGVLVPLVFSAVFFDEQIIWLKWVGVALLIVASYVMCSYNNSIKSKLRVKDIVVLIISCISNGATQFIQKWFTFTNVKGVENNLQTVDVSVFNFYTYLFAFIVLFMCYIIVTAKANMKKNQLSKQASTTSFTMIFKKIWLLVLVMAFALFMHSYLSTQAASYLPSSELYPLQQGASLMLSLMVSSLFFGERITKKCLVGIAITFVALLTINLFPQWL